jgi:transcriptional regulator with XRE-family HTH domain
VTEDAWPFGTFLDEHLRASGLTKRAVARLAGVSDTTVRNAVAGYSESAGVRTPYRPSVDVIVKLADALDFDLGEGLRLAGHDEAAALSMRRRRRSAVVLEGYTVEQLLGELRERYADLTARAKAGGLPAGQLDPGSFRARGRTISRLEALAEDSRRAGDGVAAAALADLASSLNQQLEAADAASAASEAAHPG